MHGITRNTIALRYSDQSGALSELLSDVFGSIAKHEPASPGFLILLFMHVAIAKSIETLAPADICCVHPESNQPPYFELLDFANGFGFSIGTSLSFELGLI
jgi:hypothetical protein